MENMKIDTNFVRMRSGDHLEDSKMSIKGTLLHLIQVLIVMDKSIFRSLPQGIFMILKFSDNFTIIFFYFEGPQLHIYR